MKDPTSPLSKGGAEFQRISPMGPPTLDHAARHELLREVRAALEELHAEALAERDGRVFTTDETLALLRRCDLGTGFGDS